MSKAKENNDPVTFPDKWAKVLKQIPEFKDTADASSAADLKKIIVQSEGNIYTVQKEKAVDHVLLGAKDVIKERSGPYRDAIKVQNAKIQYALFLLEGKGEDLDNNSKE